MKRNVWIAVALVAIMFWAWYISAQKNPELMPRIDLPVDTTAKTIEKADRIKLTIDSLANSQAESKEELNRLYALYDSLCSVDTIIH